MKKYLTKLIPEYSWVLLISAVSLNMLSYFGLRAIYTPERYFDLSIPLDHRLPLVTAFVIPYILAYAQWIIGYVMIARESKALCYKIMTGEIIAKLICLLCFIFLPTMISYRPETVPGDGILTAATQWIYDTDAPNNLFPSIHCLESYFVTRGAFKCTKLPRWYGPLMLVFSLFVFASTVLLKQHFIVDFFGAVFAAEFGLFIAKYLPFNRNVCDDKR